MADGCNLHIHVIKQVAVGHLHVCDVSAFLSFDNFHYVDTNVRILFLKQVSMEDAENGKGESAKLLAQKDIDGEGILQPSASDLGDCNTTELCSRIFFIFNFPLESFHFRFIFHE